MKNVGITKEIDDLGRLHSPKEIRNRLGLGGTVQLVVTEDGHFFVLCLMWKRDKKLRKYDEFLIILLTFVAVYDIIYRKD